MTHSGTGAYTTPWATYSTTNYAYDALDQLTSVTDKLLNTTTMIYDSAGRKTQMTDRDMGQWNYAYDVNGNLVKQTDARGQVLCFYYDGLDRLTAKHQNGTTAACPASQPATPSMKYTYDGGTNGKGHRTKMEVSGGASTIYTYDTRGRKISAEHTVPGLSGSRTFGWTYDSGDRLTTLTYPTVGTVAETLTYSYDAAWHAKQVCSSRAGQACYVGSATYTALDQPLIMQLNGTSTSALKRTAAYSSPLQQLSALTIGVGTGTGLFNRTYSYDNVDNVTGITDVNTTANSQSFTYDDLNRLNCWKLNSTNCSQIFTYDEIGNLRTKTGTGTLDYPTSGVGSVRPHTPSSVAGVAYSYDANGNLTGDGTRTLTWNAESLPNTVSYMSGTTSKVETSSYDADGERVKLAVTATPQGGSPATVSTVYLEGLWEEFVSGTTKVYYPFNGQMVALREVASATSNTLRYLHGDHLGSVSVSSDSAGGSVSSQEFDPWGKVRSGNVISTTLGFTGQRLDGSGLMYYHARMYNPVIGRFISADSVVPGGPGGSLAGVALKPLTVDFHEVGFVGGVNRENKQPFWFQLSDQDKQQAGKPWGPANPQALNRYSYVMNNPVKYTDPGGHWIKRGDEYYGYESVCGQDGKAACTGDNDYVDPSTGKKYVRVWVTNPDGSRSEKIVEADSDELDEFDTMLSDYLSHSGLLEQAAGVLAAALIAVGVACFTPLVATPACPGALLTAIAAEVFVIRAQHLVAEDEEKLRRNFSGMKGK